MGRYDDKQMTVRELDVGGIFTRAGNGYENSQPALAIHEVDYPTLTARLAMALAEKFGVVAANADGEDSSGRQKLCLLAPDEVAERSVSIAEILVSKLRNRGHIAHIPNPFGEPA